MLMTAIHFPSFKKYLLKPIPGVPSAKLKGFNLTGQFSPPLFHINHGSKGWGGGGETATGGAGEGRGGRIARRGGGASVEIARGDESS